MDMPAALFAARSLDSDHDLVPLVAVFNALGHKHRLSILRALLQAAEPLSVPELRVLVSGPATVLEHLKTLKAAGFVEIVGQGRASKWQVVPGSLDRAATLIASDGRQIPETAV
ncbi:helix-turn-helix domain-containing protein [Yimella sp. NH-Cas1]|uniref:ArsR/SmtB family transcription factor n=1 Tax=Yimella sp. NH-Cas1 TaxID=2917726 RepID=UPI001EFBBCE2|nr:helix-turn-helix domain-containing protein [Yimella sp. NH-Cas1]MCG8656767.1 helix-turn-helix domain-containing protein [Yimella sp. NH-Cas1]